MHVDRSRFLFLASAMAGGACASTPPATSPAPAPAPSASTVATSEPVSTPPAPHPLNPPDDAVYPSAEARVPRGPSYGPSHEGRMTPPPKDKAKRAFNSAACSGDDVAAPVACSTVREDASCAPFDFVHDMCSGDLAYLKPRIAERAVNCMRAAGPQRLCDAMTSYDCRDDALRSACADPAADAACAPIAQKCPNRRDECRGYLSGLNDAGRAAASKCLSANTACSFGIWSCIEGL